MPPYYEMAMGTCFALLCILPVALCNIHSKELWRYEGTHGPNKWLSDFADCGYRSQSPINVQTDKVIDCVELAPLRFAKYDITDFATTMYNTGHTAQVLLSEEMLVSGGLMDGQYRTSQLHFHWGSDDAEGSEHTVDGKRFPLEMHIVHYSARYPNISQAVARHDGLAVLSVLFQISDQDNPHMNWIVDKLTSILHKDNTTAIMSAFTLRDLLPEMTDKIYTYKGSLTTPPCYESVTWSIFQKQAFISSDQLAKFRQLSDPDEKGKLQNNFRPSQQLDARQVFGSYNPELVKSTKSNARHVHCLENFYRIFVFCVGLYMFKLF